ncbi:ScpA family protein [Streptomyces sp. AM2-3-1]|uniref:segregation and condensation protein A n=1 Tax=unclassified Streptomyces TaxID=2593676 RepID=UPI0028C37DFB|nr:ScpA family protein [Streptomyces sp. AM2-3-1]WNO64052.1 ScpA family protein [Streptomyces sp. AM2-3-1]WTE59013.1 segregation/condensation protein A [Streptomyces sp. NBC_01617]
MPTTDEPARTPRRPLGRGPGGRPAPSAAGAAAVVEGAAVGVSPIPSLPGTGEATPDLSTAVTDAAAAPAAPADAVAPADTAGPAVPVGAADTASVASAASAGSAVPAVTDAAAASAAPADTAASRAPADDGRFTVRLANFEGPFDLLLQLISKHKLDVTEVALSKVTDEFMAHIRAMGVDWDLDQTTEFLVVAATLLDLKAARLLPAAEVEDEADLALLEARDLLFARLLQYRAYKRIAEIFSARLESEGRRFPRTVGLEPHHAELLPEVVISIGAEGFARLAVKAMQPKPKPQVYVDHIHAPLVSVREQAEIVVARVREAGGITFRELTEDAPDTLTVVARFLALLELYREKAVTLDQEEALGELMVRWAGGEGAEPAVTDEFDQEVQDMDVQEDVQA